MATEAQIAANRANARHSSGPVTEAGKARARLNALKDGLHARLAILPGEDAEEFEALREGVLEALGPKGMLELLLADRIVTLLWRQRRGLAAEQGIYAALAGDPGLQTLQALGCAASGGGAADPEEPAPWRRDVPGALERLSRWEDRLDRAIRHTHRLFDREQTLRYENDEGAGTPR